MVPFVHGFSKILLRQKLLMEGLRFLLDLVAPTNRNWRENRSNESEQWGSIDTRGWIMMLKVAALVDD